MRDRIIRQRLRESTWTDERTGREMQTCSVCGEDVDWGSSLGSICERCSLIPADRRKPETVMKASKTINIGEI